MKYIFLILIWIPVLTLAQHKTYEIILEEDMVIKGDGVSTLTFMNGEPHLILIDKRGIRDFLLEGIQKPVFYKRPGYYRKSFVGIVEENNPTLIFKEKNKLLGLTLNESTKSTIKSEIPVDIPKSEIALEYFTNQKAIYVITITKKSSILNLYQYDTKSLKSRTPIDLSDHFADASLNTIIKGAYSLNEVKGASISIWQASRIAKLYVEGETAYITIERGNKTGVLSISLKNAKSHYTTIPFTTECYDESGQTSKSNSFLFEKNLYQAKVCSDGIYLNISDLEGQGIYSWVSGNLDQSTSDFQLRAEDIQSFDKKIKKIRAKNLAVLVKASNDKKMITIGGSILITTYTTGPHTTVSFAPSYTENEEVNGFLSQDPISDSDFVSFPYEIIDRQKDIMDSGYSKFVYSFKVGENLFLSYYEPLQYKYRIVKYNP